MKITQIRFMHRGLFLSEERYWSNIMRKRVTMIKNKKQDAVVFSVAIREMKHLGKFDILKSLVRNRFQATRVVKWENTSRLGEI